MATSSRAARRATLQCMVTAREHHSRSGSSLPCHTGDPGEAADLQPELCNGCGGTVPAAAAGHDRASLRAVGDLARWPGRIHLAQVNRFVLRRDTLLPNLGRCLGACICTFQHVHSPCETWKWFRRRSAGHA
jgi:hypothetical protein